MSFISYMFTTFLSERKMHDSAILACSGLLNDLEQFAYCDGRPMCVCTVIQHTLYMYISRHHIETWSAVFQCRTLINQ